MSESRDASEALDDEGNASSSTPLEEAATETEGSAKENAAAAAAAISQLKSGGGFVNRINDYPLPITDTFGEFQRLVRFLFQMELTQSDIERCSLSIPFEKARFHFPPMNRVSIHQIVITDARNDNWFMTLTYNALKGSALITSGWQGFVDWHGLKALDVIRFYKPILGYHPKHFLIDYVKAEGNVVSTSENSHTKQVRDEEVRHDVISESKFGGGPSCSSERAKQEQQGTDGKFHRRAFLFELWLSPDDIEQGMLYIMKKKAAKHFPPIPTHLPNYKYEHQIVISDTQNQNWNMTLVYNSFLSAFFITRGWHQFVVRHGVKVTDVICFYRPLFPLHDLHFLIEHVKRGINSPEFKPENFLFELQLNSIYGRLDWLKLPKEEVRNHFPAIEKPGGKRQLYFNDAQNNDWSMAIFFDQDIDAYVIMDGWEGFVSKHRLEEMDVIRFYKPVWPAHEGHFLIECVKIEDAAPGTTSQDDQSDDGEGGNLWGDCANRGDRKQGGGGGGGLSRGGGSSHDMGETICCWPWKKERWGRERAAMALEEFLEVTDSAREEMAI